MGDRGTNGRAWIGLAARLLIVVATVGLAAVAVAAAASKNAHPRRRHKAPIYRGTQGAGGGFCSNRPFYVAHGGVSHSQTLKIVLGAEPITSQGDLLLAAITSEGQVTPPAGWSRVPAPAPASSGTRLQVFYKIIGRRTPLALTFTTSTAQRMTGGVLDLQGVRQSHPIGTFAGQVNPRSGSVVAPSLSPTSPDSLLVFLGATHSAVKWSTPQGMKAQYWGSSTTPPVKLFIATQRWHPAAGTGGRAARIASPASSVGELIALTYPEPVTCPKAKLVSHRFKANRQGILSVPMKCDWTARCRGWFEGAAPAPQSRAPYYLPGPVIAVSHYSIPPGQTRKIRIALTRHGRKLLTQHHRLPFLIELWTARSNHQLVWGAPDIHNAKLIAPGG